MGRLRKVLFIFLLGMIVTNMTGCALAWFIAGAGTAATVASVATENSKNNPNSAKDAGNENNQDGKT